MNDVLMIIGGVTAACIIILGFVMHNAPTMKDETEEKEEK